MSHGVFSFGALSAVCEPMGERLSLRVYLQEVTPREVAMAVITVTAICRMSFQVDCFIILSMINVCPIRPKGEWCVCVKVLIFNEMRPPLRGR